MYSVIRTLFLQLLLLTGFTVSSQEIVFVHSQPKQHRIPWKPAGAGYYTYSNSILKEIAKFVLREPYQVDVRFDYLLTTVVTRNDRHNRLAVFITDRRFSGDCWFRRFPLGEVLQPALLDLNFRIAGIADTSSYSESRIRQARLKPGDSLVGYYAFPAFDPELDTLLPGEPVFSWDSAALDRFNRRIDLINDYYASVALLDSLTAVTNAVNFTRPFQLPDDYIRVLETNRVVDLIQGRRFSERLTGGTFDPASLIPRLTAADKLSRSFTYTLGEIMPEDEPLVWSDDLKMLADQYIARVISYVRRSLQMDHLFGKIYYDYLTDTVMTGRTRYGISLPSELLARMFPGARKDTLVQHYSGLVAASCIKSARRLMKESRFAEAFALTGHISLFMPAGVRSQVLTKEFDDVRAMAAEGILNAYVGIASACIRTHKFEMADRYLSLAGDYARERNNFVRSDSALRAVYSELFFMRNAGCEQLLGKKQYQAALDCYAEFERLYSEKEMAMVSVQLGNRKKEAYRGLLAESEAKLSEALRRGNDSLVLERYQRTSELLKQAGPDSRVTATLDSIAPLTGRIRYEQLIGSGIRALDRRKFTYSLALFREAGALAERYSLVPDPDYDSLYRRSMGNYLLVRLTGAQRYIWTNDFDSAYYHLGLIRKEAAANGFTTDQAFVAAVGRFEQRVQEQRCRSLKDSVELWMIRADRAIQLKNFINAATYLDEALRLSRTIPACGFDDRAVRDTLARYQHAIVYHKNLAEIDALVASGSFDEAIRLMEANELLYQAQRLDRFGFPLKSVYDYVSERGNPFLSFSAIIHYAVPGKGAEALRYLRMLSIQRLPERETALFQKQVAMVLARDDFYHDNGQNPKQLADIYTAGDPWFFIFRAAYLEEWAGLLNVPVSKFK
jgi:hypothetical protein